MNVLIIDDNLVWASLVEVLLAKLVKKIKHVETFAEALSTLEKPNGYHVVLLDLKLPDSTPEMTINRIDYIKATGRKVVLVTGLPIECYPADISTCGADGFIYKGDIEFAKKLRSVLEISLP